MAYPILDSTPTEDIHADMHNAWVDVKSHCSAVGDGVTDDTAAIQAALGELDSTLGGTIFFPPGIYYCAGALSTTGERVHFKGSGRVTTQLKLHINAAYGLNFGNGTDNKHYFTLEDMTISGNGTVPAALVQFNKCFVVSLKNVSMADAPILLLLSNGGHASIVGNLFNFNTASTQRAIQASAWSMATIVGNTIEGFASGQSTFLEFTNSTSNAFTVADNVMKEDHNNFIAFQSNASLIDATIVGNTARDEKVSFFNLPSGQSSTLTDAVIANNNCHGTAAGSSVGIKIAGTGTRVIVGGNNVYNYATQYNLAGTSYATYAPTNVSTDRAYDANATTTDELADVLGTLIADLKLGGYII